MKKGMVLINVIVVMTVLNILVLSTFMMNKNILKSRAIAIKTREKQIYFDSKIQLADYVIMKLLKLSLLDLKDNLSAITDKSQISEKLKAYLKNRLNSIDYDTEINTIINNEMGIRINGSLVSTSVGYDFEIEYKSQDDYNQQELKYIAYSLKSPVLSDEDISEIELGNIDNIYEKYKAEFIESRIVY